MKKLTIILILFALSCNNSGDVNPDPDPPVGSHRLSKISMDTGDYAGKLDMDFLYTADGVLGGISVKSTDGGFINNFDTLIYENERLSRFLSWEESFLIATADLTYNNDKLALITSERSEDNDISITTSQYEYVGDTVKIRSQTNDNPFTDTYYIMKDGNMVESWDGFRSTFYAYDSNVPQIKAAPFSFSSDGFDVMWYSLIPQVNNLVSTTGPWPTTFTYTYNDAGYPITMLASGSDFNDDYTWQIEYEIITN